MKLSKIALTLGLVLGCAQAVQAATVVQNLPSWWVASDPSPGGSPSVRDQRDNFSQDPNTGATTAVGFHDRGNGDYTYNGYPPSVLDNWTLTPIGAYDLNIGADPFLRQNGASVGDGKGVQVDTSQALSKLMGNLATPLDKFFYVELTWYGDATLNIGVNTVGSLFQLNQTQTNDGLWHNTLFTGIIKPQPDQETFTFSFSNVNGSVFLDSAFVGTHCFVPEPDGIALLGLAGLAGAFARRRKV
jgi:hypothetical protein